MIDKEEKEEREKRETGREEEKEENEKDNKQRNGLLVLMAIRQICFFQRDIMEMNLINVQKLSQKGIDFSFCGRHASFLWQCCWRRPHYKFHAVQFVINFQKLNQQGIDFSFCGWSESLLWQLFSWNPHYGVCGRRPQF